MISLDNLTRSSSSEKEWLIFQNRTIAILRLLNTDGQKIVIDFLRKLDLLNPTNKHGLFHKANLSNISLVRLDLSGVDFSGADISNAILSGADLSNTNLSGANLSRSIIENTDFKNADLRGANLSRSKTFSSDFSGLSSKPLRDSDDRIIPRSRPVNPALWVPSKDDVGFSGADFRGAKLENVELAYLNLSGANFMGTNLSSVQLHNTNLSGANLMGVNLSDQNLSRIDFSNTDLKNANLLDADLSGAKFTNTDLSDTKLCGQATELCTPPFPTTYSFLGFTMSDSNRVKLCGTVMPNKKIRNDDCPRISG